MVRRTSVEAYHAIQENGLLSLRRWQVYEVLYDIGPATGGEVFKEMLRRHGLGIPSNSNTITRLGELRERGVVEEMGIRQCSVSGQRVLLWDVTDKLPSKIKKKKRRKCEVCNGRGYFNESE